MSIVRTQRQIDKRIAGWRKVSRTLKIDTSRSHLRGSQPKAFSALKGKRHVILNAPTGWGKSFVIICLILWKLQRNRKLRCIIAVPQTVIGTGFSRRRVFKVPGLPKLFSWVVGHNLCGIESTSKSRAVMAFLRGPNRGLDGRVLLCTHATLAQVYRRLKRTRRLSMFTNTVLWVDEAHHAMNAQVEGSKGTVSNSLGALVRYCVIKGNNHVGLATATFMRGDRRHIVSDEMEQAYFARHDVPYDEYFNTTPPVESFTLDIVCGHQADALVSVFKDVRRSIIYIPKRQSRHASGDKYLEVRQIIKLLAARLSAKIERSGDLILLKSARKTYKVLDLVTESGRARKKAFLEQINGPDDLDIIIALDMCKEGFDWVYAERSVIVGERHSITEMIQMIGRLFRPADGKHHADIYQVIPATIENQDQFKNQRNGILTAIFATMLLEDVFVPCQLSGNTRSGGKRRLADKVPDSSAFQALLRDFFVAVQGKTYEQSLRFHDAILARHGIPKRERRDTWNQLWARTAILIRRSRGLSVENIKFEVLKKTDLSGGLLTLCSEMCGAMTFSELREVIGRATRTDEEWVEVAEDLAIKNAAGRLAA